MGRVLSEGYAEIYEGFLAYEKPRIAASSLDVYASRGYMVMKWFEEEGIALEEAAVQDVLRYKEELSGRFTKDGKPYGSSTVNQFLTMTRNIFQYLVASEKRLSNPMLEVTLLSLPFRVCRNYLSETQMLRLLTKLSRFDEAKDMHYKRRRYRVHVIAEVLYATGLRQHELVKVEERHINLSERTIYIPCGKGGQSRTVFLTGYAAEVLRMYLGKGRPAAMPWYKDSKMKEMVFGSWIADVVRQELRLLCRELEIPIITCHGFRHSLGTHLLRAGCDIRHIQVILGHDNVKSTTTYTHMDKDDLKKSLDAHHPRQWNTVGNL